MIAGAWAFALNVIEFALLNMALCSLTVAGVLTLFKTRLHPLSLPENKPLLWGLAILPWLAGLLSVGLFLLYGPQLTSGDSAWRWAHWHHANTYDISSWHSVSLLVFGACLVVGLSGRFMQLYRQTKQYALLKAMSSVQDNGLLMLDTPQISAFTAGVFRPKCFFTSGLFSQVSVEQQQVIMLHEQAHQQMKDPFRKWCFSLLCVVYPRQIRVRLQESLAMVMELKADAWVAKHCSSLLIASTLVKVAKLGLTDTAAPAQLRQQAVLFFDGEAVEIRVKHLLGMTQVSVWSKLWLLPVLLSVPVFVLPLLDSLHHSIEFIFSH